MGKATRDPAGFRQTIPGQEGDEGRAACGDTDVARGPDAEIRVGGDQPDPVGDRGQIGVDAAAARVDHDNLGSLIQQGVDGRQKAGLAAKADHHRREVGAVGLTLVNRGIRWGEGAPLRIRRGEIGGGARGLGLKGGDDRAAGQPCGKDGEVGILAAGDKRTGADQ